MRSDALAVIIAVLNYKALGFWFIDPLIYFKNKLSDVIVWCLKKTRGNQCTIFSFKHWNYK